MKHVKFFSAVFIAAGILLISSCNSADDKKTETPTTDTSAVKQETIAVTPPPAPAPGPKLVMTVTHKVADFDKWKSSYESNDSIRQTYGLHNYVITRGLDDPNMVMVALRMDDPAKAKALAATQGMKDRMKKAGVTGPTTIDYLESVLNDTTAIQQTIRLMVKIKVKDWDAWKAGFDGDKQARIDAGLTDRVISHTVGDNHKVTLVFAVADTAKSKAFGHSKELKEKMDKGGVVGPPSVFYYKVAARY